MALELATAIVKVKFDRAQIKAETKKARNWISKDLGNIVVRVKVQVDPRSAMLAGQQASRLVGNAASLQAKRSRHTGARLFTSTGTSSTSGGSVSNGDAEFLAAQRRERLRQEQNQRSAIRAQQTAERASARWERRNGLDWSGMPLGRQRRFGGAGRSGFGRVPGNIPRFGGMGAAGLGAAFQIAPGLATAAAFGGPYGLAGAAIASGGIAAHGAYRDFEKEFGMVRVLQRRSGASNQDIARLEGAARSSGTRSIYGASESASAMRVLTQSGLGVNDIQAAIPNVENMATADGLVDLGRAAEITATSMSQFNLAGTDTARIVDALTIAANESLTSVENIGTALGYVGPEARLAGESIESVAAMIATLSQNAVDASRAGTGLRQLFRQLGTSKVQDSFLNNLGIDIRGMKPTDAIRMAGERLSTFSPAAQREFIGKNFRENSATTFQVLTQNQGMLGNIQGNIAAGSGSTAEVAAARRGELINKTAALVAAFERLGISVLKLVEGPLGLAIDGLAAMINATSLGFELLGKGIGELYDWMVRLVDWIKGREGIQDQLPKGGQGAAKPKEVEVAGDDEFGDLGGRGSRSGSSFVGTAGIWEHIQRGLGGDRDLLQQIADNTKVAADAAQGKGAMNAGAAPALAGRDAQQANREMNLLARQSRRQSNLSARENRRLENLKKREQGRLDALTRRYGKTQTAKKKGAAPIKGGTAPKKKGNIYDDPNMPIPEGWSDEEMNAAFYPNGDRLHAGSDMRLFLPLEDPNEAVISQGDKPQGPWDKALQQAARYAKQADIAYTTWDRMSDDEKSSPRGQQLYDSYQRWKGMYKRTSTPQRNPSAYSGVPSLYMGGPDANEIDRTRRGYHADATRDVQMKIPTSPTSQFELKDAKRRQEQADRDAVTGDAVRQQMRNNPNVRGRKAKRELDADIFAEEKRRHEMEKLQRSIPGYRESSGANTKETMSSKKFIEFLRSGAKSGGWGVQDDFMNWWNENPSGNAQGIRDSQRAPEKELKGIEENTSEALDVLEEIARNTRGGGFTWS